MFFYLVFEIFTEPAQVSDKIRSPNPELCLLVAGALLSPSLFLFLPIRYPFRRLLCRLGGGEKFLVVG